MCARRLGPSTRTAAPLRTRRTRPRAARRAREEPSFTRLSCTASQRRWGRTATQTRCARLASYRARVHILILSPPSLGVSCRRLHIGSGTRGHVREMYRGVPGSATQTLPASLIRILRPLVTDLCWCVAVRPLAGCVAEASIGWPVVSQPLATLPELAELQLPRRAHWAHEHEPR